MANDTDINVVGNIFLDSWFLALNILQLTEIPINFIFSMHHSRKNPSGASKIPSAACRMRTLASQCNPRRAASARNLDVFHTNKLNSSILNSSSLDIHVIVSSNLRQKQPSRPVNTFQYPREIWNMIRNITVGRSRVGSKSRYSIRSTPADAGLRFNNNTSFALTQVVVAPPDRAYLSTSSIQSKRDTFDKSEGVDAFKLPSPRKAAGAQTPFSRDGNEAQMQELAMTLQSLRDPKHYKTFVQANGPDFHDNLLYSTIKVVNFYTNPTTVIPLANFKRSLVLSGPEFCHSLVTSVILPYFGQCITMTPKQIDGLLHISFKTIQSLGKLCMNANQQSWKSNTTRKNNMVQGSSAAIQLGDLAEELLRQVLNTPISICDVGRSTHEENRTTKVTHLYNNTLNTWSVIAATERDPMIAKDAALRAERLLLDLAMSRRGKVGHDGTNAENAESKSTLLKYLQPDVVSFNTAIKAWSKSGRFEHVAGQKVDVTTASAAERSESILRLLLDLHDKAKGLDYNDSILPDRMSYEPVIQAWSRAYDPEAPERATKILEDMVERYNQAYSEADGPGFNYTSPPPFPSRQTFSSVLTTWARTSLMNPSSTKCSHAIESAESLFRQMKKLGDDGYVQNKPDTIAYNALLQVYANNVEFLLRQKHHRVATIESAIGLCNRMEELVAEMVRVSSNKGNSITNEETYPDYTTHKVAMLPLINLGTEIMSLKKNQKISVRAIDCALKAKDHLKELTLSHSPEALHLHSVKALISIFASTGDTDGTKDVYDYFSTLQAKSGSLMQVSGNELEEILELLLQSRNGRLVVADLEDAMFDERQNDMGFQPSTRMLNSLIDANAKLASEHVNYSRQADRIMMIIIGRYKSSLDAISKGGGTVEHYKVARPNTFTMHSVIAAYADACGNRDLPSKSRFEAIERMEGLLTLMEDMHREKMNPGGGAQVANYTAAVRPNVKTYNILLKAYNSRTKFVKDIDDVKFLLEKAEKLVKRMAYLADTEVNTSAKPDHYTYSSLLNILAQSKVPEAPEKATDILRKAFAADSGIGDIIVINTALKAIAGVEGSVKEVVDMYERLEDGYFGVGMKPDKFTFSTVMAALGDEGTIEAAQKVEDLYHRMTKRFESERKGTRAARQIQPDIYCYNSIISAWANVKSTESCQRAENHLDSLLQAKTGIEADGSSFSSLIFGLSQKLDSTAASDCERILDKKEIYQIDHPNIPINLTDYNLTIKTYSEQMNPDGCFRVLERILKRMISDDIKKPVNLVQLTSCFNAVMNSYYRASHKDASSKIQEIFNLMESSTAAKPDKYTYALLMNAHAQSRSKDSFKIVDDLLERILQESKDGKRNVRPTIIVFNLLFKACELSPTRQNSDENPVTTAFDRFALIQDANKWNIKLNHHTYSHMFAICRNHVQDVDKKDELVRLLFQKTCHDGQLSELALTLCKDSMSTKKFANVVASIVGERVDPHNVNIHDFPQSCKCNVLPPKHVSPRRY